jgi:8-oxo-dGTP diphosphatase
MKKVVAKALLFDNSNHILLLYRGLTHPYFPNHPDFPGGEVEKNEDWFVAVCREIEEETGIPTTPHQIYCLFQKEYSNVIHVLYKVKLKTSAQTVPIKLSWEHRDYKWITRRKLCQITPPDADRYYLDVIEYLCASTPELP